MTTAVRPWPRPLPLLLPAVRPASAPGLSASERRAWLLRSLALAGGFALTALGTAAVARAQPAAAGAAMRPHRFAKVLSADRALREMQIFEVPALGLEVWVENQPPWEVGSQLNQGQPLFYARSPDNYHPPAAMTVMAWPKERVADGQLVDVARSTIYHASRNFGLAQAQARQLDISSATHGVLGGQQAEFEGRIQGTPMDVRLFVGQSSGSHLVVLSIYTLAGKMGALDEVVRRSWGNLAYLS